MPSISTTTPAGWVVDGQLTPLGVDQVAALVSGETTLALSMAAPRSAAGADVGAGVGPAGQDSALPGAAVGSAWLPGAAAHVVAALTRSELAVAELVAAGMTNRQIAESLFVSPRTIDAHLSHIYRKLEIPSRARLAALMSGSR